MQSQERGVALQLGGWTGSIGIALLLNRLSLGLVFLMAGVTKIKMGPGKFYREGFLPLQPAWLPEAFASPYGHALPYLEFVLGAMLIVGFLGRITAGAIALMLISFTIALAAAGMFFKGGGPFHLNVVLATLAILLAATGPGAYSLDHLIRRRKIERAAPSLPAGA